MILSFGLIIFLVLLNGFFVSVEFAAVASRRARLEVLAEDGNRAAHIVTGWLENPATRDRLIAASQLGITIVSLALGAIGENTFEELLTPVFHSLELQVNYQAIGPLLASLPLVLSLIIVTSMHVVLGEQVPKVATLHDPERFALIVARPMQVFALIFKWFIDLLDWVTRLILRMVGLEMIGEHLTVYTVEELRQILTDSEAGGIIPTPEREMLDAIFDLNELVVRQVMIPRTEMLAVEAGASLDEIINLATRSTYTKFPVYENHLDQVVGVVHVKDLLRAMQNKDSQEYTARQLMREPIFVPETILVSVVLQQFRDHRQHLAIVLDEYGGTAGLITLEDLLEEIVGEVSDPFDPGMPEIQILTDGSAMIDGLALIEDVNHHLLLDLVDPDYDTIAGYVLGKLGRMPRLHDTVEGDGIRLRVETLDGMRIARVSLTRIGGLPLGPEPVEESDSR